MTLAPTAAMARSAVQSNSPLPLTPITWLDGGSICHRSKTAIRVSASCNPSLSISFFLFIIYILLVTCVQSSKQNAALNSKYTKLAGYLIVLWIAYPLVWGPAEAQEIISVQLSAAAADDGGAAAVFLS